MQIAINTLLTLLLSIGLVFNVFAETLFESDRLHSPFTEVLKAHVDNGRVNYTGIKEDPRFSEYLRALKLARPDTLTSEVEKLAFWINAYNALAIKGILDGLSPDSFFGRIRYFKSTDYEVGARKISLYDLEHKIIIPFNEPRIHFAIVCASLSCPKLRSEAYLASRLSEQLKDNTIDFINDKKKNKLEFDNKLLRLSKIFSWYKKDFKQHSGSVQKYVANFVEDHASRQALLKETYRIKHLEYDWQLNGTLEN